MNEWSLPKQYQPKVGDESVSAYTNSTGFKPGGEHAVFAFARDAESVVVAGGVARGIRYDKGRVVAAGEYPVTLSAATTGDSVAIKGDESVHAGSFPLQSSTNMGVEALSTTYLGAHASAGSDVHYMAAEGATTSHTEHLMQPQKVYRTRDARESVAFSRHSPDSTATSGQGSGPVALSWGYEVAAAARADRGDPADQVHWESVYFRRQGLPAPLRRPA